MRTEAQRRSHVATSRRRRDLRHDDADRRCRDEPCRTSHHVLRRPHHVDVLGQRFWHADRPVLHHHQRRLAAGPRVDALRRKRRLRRDGQAHRLRDLVRRSPGHRLARTVTRHRRGPGQRRIRVRSQLHHHLEPDVHRHYQGRDLRLEQRPHHHLRQHGHGLGSARQEPDRSRHQPSREHGVTGHPQHQRPQQRPRDPRHERDHHLDGELQRDQLECQRMATQRQRNRRDQPRQHHHRQHRARQRGLGPAVLPGRQQQPRDAQRPVQQRRPRHRQPQRHGRPADREHGLPQLHQRHQRRGDIRQLPRRQQHRRGQRRLPGVQGHFLFAAQWQHRRLGLGPTNDHRRPQPGVADQAREDVRLRVVLHVSRVDAGRNGPGAGRCPGRSEVREHVGQQLPADGGVAGDRPRRLRALRRTARRHPGQPPGARSQRQQHVRRGAKAV